MLPLAQRQQPRCQQPRCRGDAVLEQLPVQIPRASAVPGDEAGSGAGRSPPAEPTSASGSGWIIADVLQGVCVP